MLINVIRITAQGRVNRTTFIAYSFLYIVGAMALLFSIEYLPPVLAVIGSIVVVTAWVLLTFSLAIRRVHDFNRNGWFALLFLVPLVNLLLLFWPGSPSENRYGAKPNPSPVIVKILAVVAFTPFLLGLLFSVPRDESKDKWEGSCNFSEHASWWGTYTNGRGCWEAADRHFEEYLGTVSETGEAHSVRCRLVETAFPMSLFLKFYDSKL